MFSTVAIFKVRVARELGRYLNIGLSEWSPVSSKVEDAENPSELSAVAAAAQISAQGNWMWAVARAIENRKPFNVYGYAAFDKGKWLFDMHVGNDVRPPRFGNEIPHIYIPMSDIFFAVYIGCRNLLRSTNLTRARIS